MLAYKLLYLASLIAFTFGAVTFSVLTLYYWREWRAGRRQSGAAFPAFTLVCAGSFVLNLLLRLTAADSLSIAQALLAGILPPLLFQLVLAEAEPAPAGRGRWRITLVLFYAAAILATAAHALNDADLAPAAWSDFIEILPAISLGAAAALGLTVPLRMHYKLTDPQQRYRRWTTSLLVFMLACSLVNLFAPGPIVSLLPDYLVL